MLLRAGGLTSVFLQSPSAPKYDYPQCYVDYAETKQTEVIIG